MANVTKSIEVHPSGYDETNHAYASVNSSYPLSNAVGKGSNNTTYAQWNLTTGSEAESYVFYTFDLSEIPETATINSVSCSAKAYISSTSSWYINSHNMQMYHSTSNAKGSSTNITTSATAQSLDCGSWTRDELNDCRIRIYAKRSSYSTSTSRYIQFYGATLTISYSYEGVTYIISTSSNDGGTIDPSGENNIPKGNNFVLVATPNADYDLKKITLDGVDVTSQAVHKKVDPASYAISDVSGASYNFTLNSNGYYESTNKGHASSAALCRVTFNLPVSATVNFYVINYAESTYDYGILGNIDQELSTSYTADSTYHWSGSGKQSADEQLVTYSMDAGESFVEVKFRKDSSQDSNNDSLQFRVEIVLSEDVPTDTWYYEYTLENVQAAHTIVVTFGKDSTTTIYVKESGAWVAYSTAYKKTNGVWVQVDDLTTVFESGKKYLKGR